MKEFFSDVLGLPLSGGGIHNILQRFTKKALPFYLQIKEGIKDAVFFLEPMKQVQKSMEKNIGFGHGKMKT